MSLTATFNICIQWALTKALALSNPRDSQSLDRSQNFASASGASQADCMWHDKRTLTLTGPGATETLDLTAERADPLGNLITMAKLKALFILNKSVDAGLKIGAAETTPVAMMNAVGVETLNHVLEFLQAIPSVGYIAI